VPLRRTIAVSLGIVGVLLSSACSNDEPRRIVGSEITIPAPAESGSAQTIQLHGFERGEGPVGVVLAHMLGSTQDAWILFVEELVKQDFHVLTFDFRGHGLSGGQRNPSLAALDLGAAVEKLRALGVSKIFVIGASMGGTAAVVVAAGQELEGVVTISAPLSIDRLDASEAVGMLDEPSFFIVGENDDVRYTEAAQRFASLAPAPRRLQVIDGSAAHGTDLLTEEAERQRVTDLIVDFFITYRE
jgi:pimeloyl-ACP methyl ester carboxylesterase